MTVVASLLMLLVFALLAVHGMRSNLLQNQFKAIISSSLLSYLPGFTTIQYYCCFIHSLLRPLQWVAIVPCKSILVAVLFIWSYRLEPVQLDRRSMFVLVSIFLVCLPAHCSHQSIIRSLCASHYVARIMVVCHSCLI